MMMSVDVRMAIDSMRTSRWRSFLTMLGIIIGVASVVTIVSVGEGVKQQVTGQIQELGADLITIRPGKSVTRNADGSVQRIDMLQAFASGASFSDSDLQAVSQTPNAHMVAPLAAVTGGAAINDVDYADGMIIGTSENLPQMLKQKVLYGGFFRDSDINRNVAVIGKHVAESAFKQNAPIGEPFKIHGETFIVAGVFDTFALSPLAPNTDYNADIFIPYDTAKRINNGQAQIQQILVRPAQVEQTQVLSTALEQQLRNAHGGQADFTILRQEDNMVIAGRILDMVTTLISAIAAISLLVGGVGIMNIMLVSVSERTHEIGVRKAIGATSRQIMRQFMIESAILSFTGGVIGVLIALIANYFITISTTLMPRVTLPIIGVSLLVALIVGVFFGTAPALKAARKDPIQALRHM